MGTLNVVNAEKKKVGEVSLPDAVLSDKLNKAVLYQAVKTYLAGQHHGTVRTKTRSEVNFTTKKVYRQKGTGGARHGSMKSSPFVGGGRVHGPKPRDYSLGANKKVRALALREALRSGLQDGKVVVLDALHFKEIKTKLAAQVFGKLGLKSALVVLDKKTDVIEKSIRNLKGFKTILANQLNVFDLLKYPQVLFTQESFGMVNERYLKG
ncbi:MAG TPA: 50S ribosomal protein L4 [Deltaproteobacteria bacterium]|nr:MAG: 50S ribosomal protein L4 [Deltaproteobacteria bacterium GWA2_45_12]HBF13578.1 50S ribosomal protein L4 [Deltaproteobacteria bacterium]